MVRNCYLLAPTTSRKIDSEEAELSVHEYGAAYEANYHSFFPTGLTIGVHGSSRCETLSPGQADGVEGEVDCAERMEDNIEGDQWETME